MAHCVTMKDPEVINPASVLQLEIDDNDDDNETDYQQKHHVDDDEDYTNEGHTVFIQDGQYVIPVGDHTATAAATAIVLQDTDGDYEPYVISNPDGDGLDMDMDELGQPIIYYAAQDFAEDMQHADDSENANKLDDTLEDPVPDEKLSESMMDPLFIEQQQQQPQPRYQYAILKNGKLHLQTLDIVNVIAATNQLATEEEHDDDRLQAQLEAFQQSITMDEATPAVSSSSAAATVDLDKIIGRNLITGQTVTLDSYFDKLQRRLATAAADTTTNKPSSSSSEESRQSRQEVVNRKVVVGGKTATGKKLIGKILHIRFSADTDNNNYKDAAAAIKTETEDGPNIIIKTHVVTRENFEHGIGKTLTGLMDLESVQRKLQDKNLIVKVVEKTYERNTDSIKRTVSYVYGHMESIGDDRWTFVLHNEDTTAAAAATQKDGGHLGIMDADEDVSIEMEDEWSHNHNETVSLTVVNSVDRHGQKSTKVSLSPARSESHKNLKAVQCETCDRNFVNQMVLQRHKRIHTEDRWYRCTECSKSFNTARSLKRHVTVHDPSLRPLECSICVQRFTDESNLRKHLLIHTGIRAYACDVCNRAFVNQGDLNSHRRIHDPIKQFGCEVCGREFSRHSNLMRHVEIHRSRGALHRCDVCGCSYSFMSSLTRHIVQKHIGNRPHL